MQLKSLNIEQITYGSDQGQFKANCVVVGDNSWDPSISIPITQEQLEPILGIIHGAVVAALDNGVKQFREQVEASFRPAVEATAQPQLTADE
jgi:hypothetical protein